MKFLTQHRYHLLILLIFLIKLSLFIFYTICFHLYPETSIKHGLLYVVGGDTYTYYPPIINVLTGGDYGLACRMPGLIIPFAPLYLIIQNEEIAFDLVIIFQFILSTISVYILGLIANILFNNNSRIFLITLLLYSFWYHIGDHYLLADSIANSTFIFAVYFFLTSLKEDFENKKHVFYSGLFFTWSIFTRLIAIVPFMILCVFIFYSLLFRHQQIKKFFYVGLLFTCSFILCESAWIFRNKISLNKYVPLPESENCYSSFSYNWNELNKIPTAWGYETTHWAGEINWWLDKNSTSQQFPFSETCFTKSFDADSLTKLKNQYHTLLQKKEELFKLNSDFKKRVDNYLYEYKREHWANYYLINPIKLFVKFHYKKMIVDIPFPKLNKMNVFQKVFKATNWIFILIISVTFLISPFFLLSNKNRLYLVFIMIPFSISAFLVFLGAIEQRYFWIIIPFCVIFFAYFVDYVIVKLKLSK